MIKRKTDYENSDLLKAGAIDLNVSADSKEDVLKQPWS